MRVHILHRPCATTTLDGVHWRERQVLPPIKQDIPDKNFTQASAQIPASTLALQDALANSQTHLHIFTDPLTVANDLANQSHQ